MSPKTRKLKTKSNRSKSLWIGALAGLAVGITSNLIASWIQQDIIKNSFTLGHMIFIFSCTLIGMGITVLLGKNKETSSSSDVPSDGAKNKYSAIRLFWSKLKSRGKDISVDNVTALGSEIDINSNNK